MLAIIDAIMLAIIAITILLSDHMIARYMPNMVLILPHIISVGRSKKLIVSITNNSMKQNVNFLT